MDLKNNKTGIFVFTGVVVFVFATTFIVLLIFGLVPKSLQFFKPALNGGVTRGVIANLDDINVSLDATRPDRITIEKIGVDAIISQPNTRDVNVLDQFLTKGAVHYPGSGSIENGNLFIFAHSTGFQIVNNQAYKTFNNLDKLVRGDIITIKAKGRSYLYKVTSVRLVDNSRALVEFNNLSRTLTLSTCNTFGAKQERWVVEAEFYK